MDGPLVPGLNSDAILRTSPGETGAFELHCGIYNNPLWTAKHRPVMIDVALGQPVFLAAHRLRQTERDRQARRLLKGQTEPDDCTRCDIRCDREVRPSDKDALTVDDFHELDISRGMVDLDHIKGVLGPDIARPRFQTAQAFPAGVSPTCDLFWCEQKGDTLLTVT